jgi:hypothetical protein
MSKKDISKILTTGSPKQRVLLVAEEIARAKYFQDKLLTEVEFNQLRDSFKKPNEIKLWNEFIRLDDTITNAIVNLQGLLYEVKMRFSDIRGYILTWSTIENAELLVNSVLHEIKDQTDRKRIAKKGAKGVELLLSKTQTDQEGYIEIDIGFLKKDKVSLWTVLNTVKAQAETSVVKYLSWEKAITDFIEERGFNVRTYKTKIKEMREQLNTPIIDWTKYYGVDATEVGSPRLFKLLKKYSVCPEVDKLSIDENEYSWYRRYFLDEDKSTEELRGKINKQIANE